MSPVNPMETDRETDEVKVNQPFLYTLVSGIIIGIVASGIAVNSYFYSGGRPQPADSVTQATDVTESSVDLKANDLMSSAAAYLKFKEIKASTIPSGVPSTYGTKLRISFDEVQDAIDKVIPFDPTYGNRKITLSGDDLARYIKVGRLIACQYCCDAKTLVEEDGKAACTCEHSQMMRGLAAYLLKNYPQQYTDEQILEELKKWKAAFFPKQILTDKLSEIERSGDDSIKEVLKEFPEFLPQMVGEC